MAVSGNDGPVLDRYNLERLKGWIDYQVRKDDEFVGHVSQRDYFY